MTLQRFSQLNTIAVVGGEKVRANEQEDDVSLGQVSIDLVGPVGSWHNLAIMPCGNEPLLPQEAQMGFQVLLQPLVSIGIGGEDGDLVDRCVLLVYHDCPCSIVGYAIGSSGHYSGQPSGEQETRRIGYSVS
jgi:hypothetical protein